jgi:hypothetical protein
VDYKSYLLNNSVYQDSFFNEKVKFAAHDMDNFFNEFRKNNIPLKKYFKGENDEEIINALKKDLSEKMNSCYEIINEKMRVHGIDARLEKLGNGNLQIRYDMTEDYDIILKLLTTPDIPLHLERVNIPIL